jgi:hypothetical protein
MTLEYSLFGISNHKGLDILAEVFGPILLSSKATTWGKGEPYRRQAGQDLSCFYEVKNVKKVAGVSLE